MAMLVLHAVASAQPLYRFESLWPALQQPWYFESPTHGALDRTGSLLIVDTGNHRVLKFTPEGQFISAFGRQGAGPREFLSPQGIAVDAAGSIYVADSFNNRIQKFTTNGQFLFSWGQPGTSAGQFNVPRCIAVGPGNIIYVVDSLNQRIQYFDTGGNYLGEWGTFGMGPGQFFVPSGIGVDGLGRVIVSDVANHRVQRFSATGQFQAEWNASQSAFGALSSPEKVGVREDGSFVVADMGNRRLLEFSAQGVPLRVFGAPASQPGTLIQPTGVVFDGLGNVFAIDRLKYAVVKYAPGGAFIAEWSSRGQGPGRFNDNAGIAVGSSGDVFVVDNQNRRVQRFTPAGAFVSEFPDAGNEEARIEFGFALAASGDGAIYVSDFQSNSLLKFNESGDFQWRAGQSGSGPLEFSAPSGIAVDAFGHVYVVDRQNHRIQVLDSDGNFVREWGEVGDELGQFYLPASIGIAPNGDIYVSDAGNYRIQRFPANGGPVEAWGSEGSGPGQFREPRGFGFDANGNVFVTERLNNRIQVFTPAGAFLGFVGEAGSSPGQFSQPRDIAFGLDGRLYVSDTFNNRVQMFSPAPQFEEDARAIVVAAGGPYPGNNLWDATRYCANFAYRTLNLQGYTKDSIHYLSSELDLDLDGNGIPDTVSGDATNENLRLALTQWAAGADSLILYMVNHGGDGRFRMSGTEILEAEELAQWLDQTEGLGTRNITIVYEACQSGSFLPVISKPGRITIASSTASQNAYFLSTGTLSFSNFFWSQIFAGFSIGQSFEVARLATVESIRLQTPQLDDNGNGIGNELEDGAIAAERFLGRATSNSPGGPSIVSLTPPIEIEGDESVFLEADVTSTDGVGRVWAIVRPPNFVAPSPNNPILHLPTIEFQPELAGDEGRWIAQVQALTEQGRYQLAVYARDATGRTSTPALTSITVGTPLRNRAVIVATGTPSHAEAASANLLSGTAYGALERQGFTGFDIQYLSSTATFVGFDALNTINNLRSAITDWGISDTQDLTVYLVGPGSASGFPLYDGAFVTPEILGAWLDEAQMAINGRMTVIVDSCQSGNMIPMLAPSSTLQRTVIASAGPEQAASFLEQGTISFSWFFWQQVVNGATVGDAFQHARNAIRFTTKSGGAQEPQLDDNGNGIANEPTDGLLARTYSLGAGVLLAGDDPVITEASAPETLDGGPAAVLMVSSIVSTRSIDQVWAVVTPPSASAPGQCGHEDTMTAQLRLSPDGDYQHLFAHFLAPGPYDIALYAMDQDGYVSQPVVLELFQNAPASPLSLGDVNGDGQVNAVDVQLVINAALGLSIVPYNGDVNADSLVNAVDVQLTINAALGLKVY